MRKNRFVLGPTLAVMGTSLQDVINEHNGDNAANYLNPGMQWSGTVGIVTACANVAGLFASVVPAFPTRTPPSKTSSAKVTRLWRAWS